MEASLPTGVFAAALTPLRADLDIDPAALARHLLGLLEAGCDGLALFGTTGEATTFSIAERTAALEAVAAAGVPLHRLRVGTGACALPDAAALTRHAVAAGAGGVLVLPPFYYKGVEDDGLFAFFDALIQRVGDARLRIYLYHFPKMSGVPISAELAERLARRYPSVLAGVKDSSGDLAHTGALIERLPGLRIFAGTERLLLDALRAGGAGCISATANVTAPHAAAVLRAWRRGRAEEAEALQRHLSALRQALEAFPVIPALKHRTGLGPVRPPLTSLPPEVTSALDAQLRALAAAQEEG
ncbi:MAG: dihydrodipicolinate synthase family protein [Rhodothermales bacterium]|nr:dihydrodipicolinate synthase family protein [Rhodothermales bacterium]